MRHALLRSIMILLEVHRGFEVEEINSRTGYGNLHRAQRRMPLDNEVIMECILQKCQMEN